MRHKNAGRKLGRNPSHRKALFRNMAKALLTHGRITTTEAKAKSLRGIVEPLITLALKNDLHARRQAYRVLGEHKLVNRLFDEIGPLFVGGGGGYTRVVTLAMPRKGDAAPLAIIELTKKAEVAKEADKKDAKAEKAAKDTGKPKAAAKPKAPKADAGKPARASVKKAPKSGMSAAASRKAAAPRAAKISSGD